MIRTDLLQTYLTEVPVAREQALTNLHDAPISTDTFSFYTSVSAMASSKIEGEPLEIDSYIKHILNTGMILCRAQRLI